MLVRRVRLPAAICRGAVTGNLISGFRKLGGARDHSKNGAVENKSPRRKEVV